MKKNLFCLTSMMMLFLFSGIWRMNAQVVIGENVTPHPGAILELRTSKGLLLSKASLVKVDSFQLSTVKVKEATGMIVYNTNPNMEKGQGVGVYLWSGSRWNLLEDNDVQVIDCTDAPKITSISGFDGRHNLNENFNVTCNTVTTGTTKYLWTVPSTFTIVGGQGSAVLTLKGTAAGTYSGLNLSCMVSNLCGGASKLASGSMIINNCTSAPTANIASVSGIYKKNNEFTITCTATGNITGYKWEGIPSNFTVVSGQTSSTLKLRVNAGNAKISINLNSIYCTVSNDCGSTIVYASGIVNIKYTMSQGPGVIDSE